MTASRVPSPTAGLAIIRIALLAGVLTFGLVTWFLHRSPDWTPGDTVSRDALLRIGQVLWAAAILAEAVLFAMVRRQSAPERRPGVYIAAWALAEMVALYGGIYYFLTDEPRWYLWGVGFMLLSYFAFPIRRR